MTTTIERDWARVAGPGYCHREDAVVQMEFVARSEPKLTIEDFRVVDRSGDTPVYSTDAENFTRYPWVIEYDRSAYDR